MVSTNYRDFGKELVATRPRVDQAASTTPSAGSCGSSSAPACSSIRTSNVAAAPGKQLLKVNRDAARVAAGKSIVLLKNEGNVLPISAPRRPR